VAVAHQHKIGYLVANTTLIIHNSYSFSAKTQNQKYTENENDLG